MNRVEEYSKVIETSVGRILVVMPDSKTAVLMGYDGDINSRHIVINGVPLRACNEMKCVDGVWQYKVGCGHLYRLDNRGEPTQNAWVKWRRVCEEEFAPTEEDCIRADYASTIERHLAYLKEVETLQDKIHGATMNAKLMAKQVDSIKAEATKKGIDLE